MAWAPTKIKTIFKGMESESERGAKGFKREVGKEDTGTGLNCRIKTAVITGVGRKDFSGERYRQNEKYGRNPLEAKSWKEVDLIGGF